MFAWGILQSDKITRSLKGAPICILEQIVENSDAKKKRLCDFMLDLR